MIDFEMNRTMMVDTQVRPSDVTKFPIIDAMLSVRREGFVPDALRSVAYAGENLELGEGRVLLEPRTFAKILDALEFQGDELVLDIGAGLGYSSAIMARMSGTVIAVEDSASQVSDAETALADQDVDNVVVIEANLNEGAAKHGPYDVIVLQGAVEVVPDQITDQLKNGGRIAAIFAEGSLGVVRIGYKLDGAMSWRMAFNAAAPVLPGFQAPEAFSL
ncbi:MAG: protein-L-isoaspartate O-methyltransferase [Litoreibacter sp.]